ncbi:MAG TPA: copper-binding protein [Candidatus Binataceae bacterium]|nr:copper-binding protein [Candidatus Binataceae bacterium]
MNSALKFSFLIALAILAGCNKNSNQQSEQTSAPASASVPSVAKRYHLKGKVVSIDKRAKMADIDSEAIPDFMEAMTMPYPVKPEGELDKLHPGDVITGDIVVQDDNSWLENIVITSHGAEAPPK